MSSDSLIGNDPGEQPVPYIGALTRAVWQWVRDQMYAGVVAAGYDDLTAAHVGLWRHPGLDGLRPNQLHSCFALLTETLSQPPTHH